MTVTQWLTTPWPYLYVIGVLAATIVVNRPGKQAPPHQTFDDDYPDYPEMYR